MEHERNVESDQVNTHDEWNMDGVEFRPDLEKEKPPKYVYRGMAVSHEEFQNVNFDDDLVPYTAPVVNESGQETDSEGNEYGVYMTDYEQMALEAYGSPDRRNGKTITTLKPLFSDAVEVREPTIGIVYKIDTEGTDTHAPEISSTMRGHYNNGYAGNEWVSRKIAKEQYEVASLSLGNDVLHDKELFSGSDRETIEKRYAERMAHIERMKADLGDSLPKELKMMTKLQLIKRLRELYGDDGEVYQKDSEQQNTPEA